MIMKSQQERTLRAHGDEYKLNAAFKVTALRVLMSCKREQFEFLEREARTRHGDRVCDDMFDDLYAKVREYAQQRRLEEMTRKSKGDPMDISQMQQMNHHWSHGNSGRRTSRSNIWMHSAKARRKEKARKDT